MANTPAPAAPDFTPCFHWPQSPLTARALLALSRVTAPLYPAEAKLLEERAELFALEIGVCWPEGKAPPLLISEEPVLLAGFQVGAQVAQAQQAHLEDGEPDIVGFGEWWMDCDGLTERRALVVKEGELFYAGFETSYRGGDGQMSWAGEGYPTRSEAMAAAENGLRASSF